MAYLFAGVWGGAYLVLLVLYLNAEAHNTGTTGFAKATALKAALGVMYTLAGITSVLFLVGAGVGGTYFAAKVLVAVGLAVAIIGDYFLQFIRLDLPKYKKGIVAFGVTQLFFIVSLFMVYGVGWLEWVLWILFTIGFKAIVKIRKWKIGEEEKLLSLYTLLLNFTAAKAIAGAVFNPGVGTLLLALGGALFLASDILLGLWDYDTDKRIHANLNWITFFTGMLLIGLSGSPAFA